MYQELLTRARACKDAFRILKNWEIVLSLSEEYKGQVTVAPDKNLAVLYPWPASASNPEPLDFLFHEFLHVALRAWARLPEENKYDAEEELVQDICKALQASRPQWAAIS